MSTASHIQFMRAFAHIVNTPQLLEIAQMPTDTPNATPPRDETPYAPRRTPRQERGAARVERLLNAAAALIAELGVEGTTTNAIAAAAATSVGSLYQFFPNKDAVVHALAERLATGFEVVKDEVLGEQHALDPLDVLMQRIVDGIGAWCDAHPAYLRLYEHATAHRTPVAERERLLLHEPVVAMVERMLARRYSGMLPAQRNAIARVQVQTVHSVAMYSASLEPHTRAPVRAELVRMLVAALSPFESSLR